MPVHDVLTKRDRDATSSSCSTQLIRYTIIESQPHICYPLSTFSFHHVMDPNDQKRPSEVQLCPDCDRLLTSDDWMEGDSPKLQIKRRRWPSRDENLWQGCMLCPIIRREFKVQKDLDQLILGCRLLNGATTLAPENRLGKRTSLELLWIISSSAWVSSSSWHSDFQLNLS